MTAAAQPETPADDERRPVPVSGAPGRSADAPDAPGAREAPPAPRHQWPPSPWARPSDESSTGSETVVLVTASPEAEPASDVATVAPAVAAPSAEAALASASPLAVAVARHTDRRRVQLRTSLTLGLFVTGIIAGAVAWRLLTVPPTAVEAFPSLPLVGEPPVAAVVAQHLAANDAQALSDSLEQGVLDAIRAQLNPLTALERVTFVKATSLDDQILSAYVVEGTDNTGARGIVGLILVVRDGAVVAQ